MTDGSLDRETRVLINFSETREFLREAYRTNAFVELFDLHVRYQLSPAQLARVVRELEARHIIQGDGEVASRYSLTEFGRCWVIKYRRLIFGQYDFWRDIPDKYAEPAEKFRIGIKRDKRVLTAFDAKTLSRRIRSS